MQYLLKEADKQVGIIELCCGTTADGQDFFAYISIPPSQYAAFKEMQKNGSDIDLTKIGQILKVGPGKEPSKEAREEMESTYNIDHDFETKLKNEINKIGEEQ